MRFSSEPVGGYERERTSGPDLRYWHKRRQWVVEIFRRLVVRSGDAARRVGAAPQLAPSPVAELLAVPASPSPTKGAFSTGDNTRNKKRVFDVASFHGTQSRGPGTRAEGNQ